MTDLLIDTGIPFTAISLVNKESILKIERVLVDTGSATTIISADFLERFGIVPDHSDAIHRMSGIGGYEYVVQKRIDGLQLGSTLIENVDIQLGDMDYGFEINGILGFDVLSKMGAIINLASLTIFFKE